MVRTVGHIEIAFAIHAHAKWLIEGGEPPGSVLQGRLATSEDGFCLRSGRLYWATAIEMATAAQMVAITGNRRFMGGID